MTVLPPVAIAGLSFVVLLLVLAHRKANLGWGAMSAFVVTAAAYGWLRAESIRWLSKAHLGSAPYHLSTPLLAVGGVPLQELLGWISAAGLSGYLADRLLRRAGLAANACQTALAAGLGMAVVCLGVETAAVTAGWWAWSLGYSATGALRFPAIALLDWGFVAIDFLLPFELWRRRAPWAERAAALSLFPVHLAGHALTSPIAPRFPLSGFDLVHLGLLAGVAGAAAWARDTSPWPASADERFRSMPLAAAAILVATTSAQLLLLGESALLWTGAPLALGALAAFRARVGSPAALSPGRSAGMALGLFALLLSLGLLARLPGALRDRDFERELGRGVSALSSGDAAAAGESLRAALRLRPEHPDVSWLLGWSEMQTGRPAEARAHLEAAVARRLASVEAVRFLALLDLREGRNADALRLLDRRRARHAETGDLAYLAWVAKGGLGGESAPAELLQKASQGELGEIFALARGLGDGPTMAACAQRAQKGVETPEGARAPR